MRCGGHTRSAVDAGDVCPSQMADNSVRVAADELISPNVVMDPGHGAFAVTVDDTDVNALLLGGCAGEAGDGFGHGSCSRISSGLA